LPVPAKGNGLVAYHLLTLTGRNASAEIRFYAELNALVAPERRAKSSTIEVQIGTTVKDLVESLGVPHTEIDVILVNGDSVDFTYQVADGDRISVYPVFEALDITPVLRLRPRALRQARFVLDVHLGRLAHLLRLLGFDAVFRNDFSDDELVIVSSQEKRILLTSDRGILKRASVTRGYLVKETLPRRQIVEVLRRFDLADAMKPFSRCLECNGILASVPKPEVEDRLPDHVRSDHQEFWRCQGCGRVYWRGSHYDGLRSSVEAIRKEI
jgi:uncharacterized protein